MYAIVSLMEGRKVGYRLEFLDTRRNGSPVPDNTLDQSAEDHATICYNLTRGGMRRCPKAASHRCSAP